MSYDMIVLGSGPGGYVAAIRAAQLGFKVAIIERESLGGICLNWGCIPTKALLKSAEVFKYLSKADEYGISVDNFSADFSKIINRSRKVSSHMNKGVEFLMKKNKVDVFFGYGRIAKNNKVIVTDEKSKSEKEYSAEHIIISVGARSRELPNLPQDGKSVIGYREALALSTKPKSMVVIGSGAIGLELAYFYNAIGTEVTIVEYLPRVAPLEDEDVSKQMERSLKKEGITIKTNHGLEKVEKIKGGVKVFIKNKDGKEVTIDTEIVLSAVGIVPNTDNIGLEDVGIDIDQSGKIIIDKFCRTNKKGYYAIGDVVPGPALAHVASAEAILCVENIAEITQDPIDYGNIPACIYTSPETASVGLTESQAKEKGYDIKVGKFPFTASGKAQASGKSEGFVKVIFDAKYGEWLGCHMIGSGVTEMISEVVVARNLETTAHEILKSIHPHPTLSESIMEAVADAYSEAIHI